MRRTAEALTFLVLAAGLHAAFAVLALHPDKPEAGGSGGDGGGGQVALAAPSGDVADLVSAWETAPAPSPSPHMAPPDLPTTDAVTPPQPLAPAPDATQPLAQALPRPTPSALGALPLPDQPPPPPEDVDVERPRSPEPPPPDIPDQSAVTDASLKAEPASPVTAPRPAARPAPAPDAPKRIAEKPRSEEPVEREAPSKPQVEAAEVEGLGGAQATAGIEARPGTGAGTESGAPGAGSGGVGGGTGMADARESLGAAVRAAIAREKSYPRRARIRRLEGKLALSVRINRNGALLEARIARSSGERILDDAALEAAKMVSRYPAAPRELAGESFSFVVPVGFQLR